ncbi:MAG: hypothetical protein LAO21_10510 [Acidobacteriia bacterium]|nr:hypothetical protein [Terriglobia bacterium]
MWRIKGCFVAALVVIMGVGLPSSLRAQAPTPAAPSTSATMDHPSPERIQEIIRKFAAKEAEFKKARELYNYQQTVKIQTLEGNHVDGEYQMVSDVTFGRDNKRIENVTYAPPSTLQRIMITKEDLDDIVHLNPFVLTTEDLEKYDIQYVGHEKLDEITAYHFSVKPKQMIGDERYFEGEIWVDDQDLQIVKTDGRPAYNVTKRTKGQRFPKFETYREQVDAKYWFPTYTRADDVLDFPNGGSVHVREVVLYKNYRQFRSETKITYGDAVEDKDKKKNP